MCCANYLHKIEYFLMAETPVTLNRVEWKKTCIWILNKIWSQLLSPKCVLKGGLNKTEIFTTGIYHLFLHKTASLLFPLKNLCWSSSSKTNDIHNISATPTWAVPCWSTKGGMWGGRPRPLVDIRQQSSTEVLFSGSWSSGGPGNCKGLSLGRQSWSLAVCTLFPSQFSQEGIWQFLGRLFIPPFHFLWIAGIENCMHNMLNTLINSTLFTSYCVSGPVSAAD